MKEKKILFICPYPENVAPSQRLKFEQYYPHFREAGYKIETSAFISPGFWKIIYKPGNFLSKAAYTFNGYLRRTGDLFRLKNYDVVYVHLWVTPLGPPLFEWLFRKLAKKLVYDIDDLVYLKDVKSRAHPVVTWLKGRKKPLFLMREADHVITCTPYLDQFVKKYNDRTTDISSTINTSLYRPKKDYEAKDVITIGWSGSHSTSKYLHLLDGVFKELAGKYRFQLVVMGDAEFYIPGINIKAFLPALSIWLLMTYSSRIKNAGLRILTNLFVIAITFAAFFFFAGIFSEELNKYSLENVSKTADVTRNWIVYASGDEGSSYDIGEFDGSLGNTLAKFPAGVIVTLFRPFPWEANKVIVALSAMEALVFLFFTLRLIFNRRTRFGALFRDPNVIFCLVFSLIFAFAIGITAGNFGALSRYKIPCLPFYGAFLMIGLNYWKITEGMTRKKVQTIRRPAIA